MMKQARTVLSRSLSNSLSEVNFRATTVRGFAAGKDGAKPSGDRVFAAYSIFKGKAALTVEPVLPTFTKIESGLRIERCGSVMMMFMPCSGERKYSYEKRQLFALSPTEVGSLISMGAADSSEFFHDPSMKSSNAGQIRKTLSVKPYADGSGFFFSLSVTNNNDKTNDYFVVPVTKGEFAVLKTAFSYALPHIMGWDRLTGQAGTAVKGYLASTAAPHQLQMEWAK